MKHPADNMIKWLLLRESTLSNAQIIKAMTDWGFLAPDEESLNLLREPLLTNRPQGFNPVDRAHRATMRYLRDQQVYELFYPTQSVEEAWTILSDPERRAVVEQALLARLDLKVAVRKINRSRNWFLTVEGVEHFRHFFWNVPSMTFDEWGRYLYGRTAMYDRYMGLLLSSPRLAFYHLRVDQEIESKRMIQDAQRIAYFTLLELGDRPGTDVTKVKCIKLPTSAVVDCHTALSTSDMAIKEVMKQFERFRMERPDDIPPEIHKLAPAGNYTGSGVDGAKVVQLVPARPHPEE